MKLPRCGWIVLVRLGVAEKAFRVGDGRKDLLEKTGWWEQPESLASDPVWADHKFEFTPIGGAQMYAYDLNGDGLNDVITS